MRTRRLVACATVLLIVASGCASLKSATRYAAQPGVVSEPFWCAPELGTALSVADCQALSAQLDLSLFFAHAHLHATDALAEGATGSSYVAGEGAPFRFRGPTSAFDARFPDTLLYDGAGPGSQVAGIEWNVVSESAPSGFAGPNDEWVDVGGDVWQLRAWMLRPFQNEPNVFATSHPCLEAGGPVYDLEAPCYAATHPNPLEILVTNDDGYDAEGIDVAVQELLKLPNVNLTISAPALNQSGQGGNVSLVLPPATLQETLSLEPVYAVAGFPADAVHYALQALDANPDLLVSGINDGQNLGQLGNVFSGTIGAARVGARDHIPAVAVSQGFDFPPPPDFLPDFPSGATALMEWVEGFLFGREGPALFQSVVNINIPTCTDGSIRGTLRVPMATDGSSGSPLGLANCASTVTTIPDDIAGFLNGYVTVSGIGTEP